MRERVIILACDPNSEFQGATKHIWTICSLPPWRKYPNCSNRRHGATAIARTVTPQRPLLGRTHKSSLCIPWLVITLLTHHNTHCIWWMAPKQRHNNTPPLIYIRHSSSQNAVLYRFHKKKSTVVNAYHGLT